MRERRNILVAAIGVVAAIGFAMHAGVRRAAIDCATNDYIAAGSDQALFCASWLTTDDPVLLATAVAAALAAVAVWLRRPELLVVLAAVGFMPAGVPEAELRAADPEGPEYVHVTRDRLGTPITPPPDKPLIPQQRAPLLSETRRLDEAAHTAAMNVFQVVGECIVKSHSDPSRCADSSVWHAHDIATDVRVDVTIHDRNLYRVDAQSAAAATPPVIYSTIFDERRKRILYTCRPARSPRCGHSRAEEKLPPG